MRFLSDHPVDPDFPHVALAPWPLLDVGQIDWVNSIDVLESWLCSHVGCHRTRWCYHTVHEQEYWRACVAFKWSQDKTMFLLAWAK
jgi:hypothetical protein